MRQDEDTGAADAGEGRLEVDPGPLEPMNAAGVSDAMRSLATERAHLELVSLGTSRAGRAIEALRLGPADAPALAVVANPSGARAFESRLVLWLAEELAAGYGDAESPFAGSAVWFIPVPHPDGLDQALSGTSASLATGHGVDNDRDGRMGEDAPVDLNGDGVISWMRVPDPAGTMRAADDDPRRTVEAKTAEGERGGWKLMPEGRDQDGDGKVAEDAATDTRVDRNFPAGWEEHADHAGRFPLDEPEAKALADFFLEHPEIGLALVYGDRDNLGKSPKGVKRAAPSGQRVPPAGVIEGDSDLLAELGKRYRELTGAGERSSEPMEGSLQSWLYEHRGVLTLGAILWEMPTEAPKEEEPEEAEEGEATGEGSESSDSEATEEATPEKKDPAPKGPAKSKSKKDKPSDEAGQLAWTDAVDPGRFLPWTDFEHPELGTVQIGGWRPPRPGAPRPPMSAASWPALSSSS